MNKYYESKRFIVTYKMVIIPIYLLTCWLFLGVQISSSIIISKF